MVTVKLYTKDPCPLCDDVKVELAALNATFPHSLQEVDIEADADLFLHYRYIIPVVEIGEAVLKAPISTMQLAAALRKAE